VRNSKKEENGMPRRKTHEDISIFFLGKPFSSVNKTLDLPVKVLGRSHRKLLHTIPEGFLVGVLLTGNIDGGISGVLHVVVDIVDSSVKKEMKKLIKNRGEKDCRKERINARRKEKRSS
jgi:hypothetical protein